MKYFAKSIGVHESGARSSRSLLGSSVLLALLVVFWAGLASSTITPNVTASRTSGVAPLFVFFDATGTSHSSNSIATWRDLLIEFDFGDPDGGAVWEHSGLSKNAAMGSTAAHVFTRPGDYEVFVSLTDPSGDRRTTTISIHVDDPNVVFAGDRTVCISSTGNFSGCPGGARHVTTSSSGPVLSDNVTSGRRILFRRGDEFSHSGTAQITNGEAGHIGAYPSTGNRPVFRMGSALVRFGSGSSGSSSRADDWRVTDLDLQGTGSGSDGIYFSGTSSNILMMNLKLRGFKKGININRFVLDVSKGHEMFHKIGVVDCDLSGVIETNGGYNIFASGQELAFMGNRIHGSLSEPVFRIQFLDRGVIQHNRISGQVGAKALIKFHGCKWTESVQPCGGVYSEYVVISDNELYGGGGGAYMVALGPQTASSPHDERLRRLTIERNYFQAGSRVQIALVAWIGDSVIRNNIFNQTGGDYWNGVEFGQRAGMPADVSGNQACLNTCYAGEVGQRSIDCVGFSSNAFSGSVARNNLLFAPGFSDRSVVAGGGASVSSGNIDAGSTSPFVVAAPKTKPDFRLSSAISNGISTASCVASTGIGADPEIGEEPVGNEGSPASMAVEPPVLLP